MTTDSNDPNLWPQIKLFRFYSYFVAASFAAMMYDWALTFEQEIELIWRKRWSLMTMLYLSLRCAGIIFLVANVLCMFHKYTWTLLLIGSMHWQGLCRQSR